MNNLQIASYFFTEAEEEGAAAASAAGPGLGGE